MLKPLGQCLMEILRVEILLVRAKHSPFHSCVVLAMRFSSASCQLAELSF